MAQVALQWRGYIFSYIHIFCGELFHQQLWGGGLCGKIGLCCEVGCVRRWAVCRGRWAMCGARWAVCGGGGLTASRWFRPGSWGDFCNRVVFPRMSFFTSHLPTSTFARMILPKDALCSCGGSVRFKGSEQSLLPSDPLATECHGTFRGDEVWTDPRDPSGVVPEDHLVTGEGSPACVSASKVPLPQWTDRSRGWWCCWSRPRVPRLTDAHAHDLDGTYGRSANE